MEDAQGSSGFPRSHTREPSFISPGSAEEEAEAGVGVKVPGPQGPTYP